jgi:tetratricopeptide (TPR) repeat protein
MPRLCLSLLGATAGIACSLTTAFAQPRPSARTPGEGVHTLNIVHAPAAVIVALDQRLPISKLAPAKIIPDLCVYKYRVSTKSPECQAFVDQSLGYYYSYVWMEAVRSAETALRHDPECAYAWFVLSRALEKWTKPDANLPLEKARELMPKAGPREKLLIQARLQEKGMWPGVGPDERKKKAAASLDELLTLYDDDEEGWFARAQLTGGTEGAVHYKALLKINPVHPGASHELVHFFENFKRPALGWPFAQAYIASSPGIPHALHMQAHLAMRIGKWGPTTDWSARAVELEKAYHKMMHVKPSEDHQYAHHLETLLRALIHDGRFAEAREVKKEAVKNGYKTNEWQVLSSRLFLADRDWGELEKLIAETRKLDKANACYLSALMYLTRGETNRAAAEVDVLRQEQQKRKSDRKLELRTWEVQGLLMCQQGSDAGAKLMQRCVDKTKDDYTAHAWGHGAYFLEQCGIGALEAGNATVAEEAFLEALAHDAGSVRAALGMQALCDRLGRSDEAQNFGKVAERCWAKADRKSFELLKDDMMKKAAHLTSEATATTSLAP